MSKHDSDTPAAVAGHPRAQGAPSASINDPEYANAAKERGEGVDDVDNPATEPGFPVPVLKKTQHAEHLHETRAHDVATTEQAHRATELADDTGIADDVNPSGGSVEQPFAQKDVKDGSGLV